MQYSSTTAFFLLPLLALTSANPILSPAHVDAPGAFTLRAIHSTSVVQNLPINANNGSLYIGKQTASVCPSASLHCPSGDTTAFKASVYDRNTTISMDVVDPAGQKLYVGDGGALAYTAPGAKVPKYAAAKSFVVNKETGHLEYHGENSFSGEDFDLLACPTGEGDDSVYQVHVNIQGFAARSQCIDIAARVEKFDGKGQAAAYQYVTPL